MPPRTASTKNLSRAKRLLYGAGSRISVDVGPISEPGGRKNIAQGVSLGKGMNGRKAPERGVRTGIGRIRTPHGAESFSGLFPRLAPWATVYRSCGAHSKRKRQPLPT